MNKNLNIITVKVDLKFNEKGFSLNELNFDELEKELGDDKAISREPLSFKQEKETIYISFLILEKTRSAGFMGSNR